MALARANCGPADPTELLQQDMVLGEGGPLEQGDSVEVKYTGWLYSGGTLGQVNSAKVALKPLTKLESEMLQIFA